MSRNCFCVSPPPAPFFYSTISLCVLEYISIRKLQHYYYVQLGTLDRKKLEFLKRVCIRSILLLFRCSLSQASMSVNTPPVHTWKALSSFSINRQVKDQNKKVANLKHKEQVEKKKSAQMLEEARRREDSLSDSSQQLQVRAQGWRSARQELVLHYLLFALPLYPPLSLSNPACCLPLRLPAKQKRNGFYIEKASFILQLCEDTSA